MSAMRAIANKGGIVFWNLDEKSVTELALTSKKLPRGALVEVIESGSKTELKILKLFKPTVFELEKGKYRTSNVTLEVVDVGADGLETFLGTYKEYRCSDVNCVPIARRGNGDFTTLGELRSVSYLNCSNGLVDVHANEGAVVLLTRDGVLYHLEGPEGFREKRVERCELPTSVAYLANRKFITCGGLLKVVSDRGERSHNLRFGGKILHCGKFLYVYSDRFVEVLDGATFNSLNVHDVGSELKEGVCLGDSALFLANKNKTNKSEVFIVDPLKFNTLHFGDVKCISACKENVIFVKSEGAVIASKRALYPSPDVRVRYLSFVTHNFEGTPIKAVAHPSCAALAVTFKDDQSPRRYVLAVFYIEREVHVGARVEFSERPMKMLWDEELVVATPHNLYTFIA